MFELSLRPQGPFSAILKRLPAPPLPPGPLSWGLSALMRSALARHPSVPRRMGAAAKARFLLDVTDAPVLLLMHPAHQRLTASSRRQPLPAHDAAIRGSLAAFLAMLHGDEDGDALFFAGALTIDGDTAAVLALRNALDDAEIDLTDEIAALARHAGPVARWLAQHFARATGLPLARSVSSETDFEGAMP